MNAFIRCNTLQKRMQNCNRLREFSHEGDDE